MTEQNKLTLPEISHEEVFESLRKLCAFLVRGAAEHCKIVTDVHAIRYTRQTADCEIILLNGQRAKEFFQAQIDAYNAATGQERNHYHPHLKVTRDPKVRNDSADQADDGSSE